MKKRRASKAMHRKKTQRIQLIAVALIAGAIGTYAVIHSLAATSKIFYVDVNSTNGTCSDSRTAAQVAQNTPLCSISKALDLATGGETINVAGGTYSPITLTRQFPQPVTIHGTSTPKPVIQGPPQTDLSFADRSVSIFGGGNLTIDNMSMKDGTIMIGSHPTLKFAQVSRNITLTNDEITGYNVGLVIRDGSQNITVENSHFHDLWAAITGPNYRITGGQDNGAPLVDGVTIRDSLLDGVVSDSMQFGDWNNVVIDHNTIRNSKDPAGIIHNDLIQFVGYSHNVRITNNMLVNSDDQILLIQPAFGPISDVTVENNIIYNAGAYAVQSQGVSGLRFINNVVWKSGYGGLLIRGAAFYGYPAVTDTIVANNILAGYSAIEGATPAYEDHNLIFAVDSKAVYGPHDLLKADPMFVDPANFDFRLKPGSPAIGAGTAQYAPNVDRDGFGRLGAPDLGAYEYGSTTTPPPTTPPPSTSKRGDVTGPSDAPDGVIDIRDISYLIRKYGLNDAKADISGASGSPDGKVDIYDLSYIIRNYGK